MVEGKTAVAPIVLRQLLAAANGVDKDLDEDGQFYVIAISNPTLGDLRVHSVSTKVSRYFNRYRHTIDRFAFVVRRRSGSVVSVALGITRYSPWVLSGKIKTIRTWAVFRNDESSCSMRANCAVNT